MGGSQSTTAVNALSSAISNVAMSTVQSCEVAATQNQSLNVTNIGIHLFGSYSLQQTSEIRSDCFSDVNKQAQLQNQIISTIAQTTTSSNVALLGAFGKSTADATANLTSIVKNNVTMSNIQQSYNAIKQNQSASFSNSGVVVFDQVQLTQGAQIFAAATLQEVDKAGVFNKISTYVDQQASATQTNPLDFIAKALGAIGNSITSSVMLFIFIIAMAVLGFVVVMKMLGNTGGSSQSPDQMSTAQPSNLARLSRLPMPPQAKVATLAAAAVVR